MLLKRQTVALSYKASCNDHVTVTYNKGREKLLELDVLFDHIVHFITLLIAQSHCSFFYIVHCLITLFILLHCSLYD